MTKDELRVKRSIESITKKINTALSHSYTLFLHTS